MATGIDFYRAALSFSLVFFLFWLGGCAAVDNALMKTADRVVPRDEVTGKRTLNIEPEEEEVKRAERQTRELLAEFRKKGVAYDTDRAGLLRLETVMKDIAVVSHRPGLPWEIHLVEHGEPNAFTVGGGKLFVFRGLFGGLIRPDDDNELAAVLAHEIAHVNCRHVGKAKSFQIASTVTGIVAPEAGKALGGRVFQASYTTVQEDEADRVGLLYMALAGYDPSSAEDIWRRAHEKYGSRPGNYTYDHSLNIDRARNVARLEPRAMKYYEGQGIRNPDYDRLRMENDLIPRSGEWGEDSGLLSLLAGGLGTFSDFLNAKEEESRRRQRVEGGRPAGGKAPLRVTALEIAATDDGYNGVFGTMANSGGRTVNRAEVSIDYMDRKGRLLYTDRLVLRDINLRPGQTHDWGTYLKDIRGAATIGARVTDVYYAR